MTVQTCWTVTNTAVIQRIQNYGNEKYAVAGINDKEFLKEIAVKYQEAVVDNY